jgi:hypothetical protein
MGATCNLSASCASPGSSALTQPQKELQTTERLLPRPCSPGPPHDTYDSPYAMTMTYDIDTRQHGNNNAMQYVILRLWPARTSRHDISTGVFGRAYLEIRAAYFTHSERAASCERRSRSRSPNNNNNAVSNLAAGERERERGNGKPPAANFAAGCQMPAVLTPKVPRAGGFPKAPAPTPPCVFRSPALFSAIAHSISSVVGPLPVFTWFPCADSCSEPIT